MRSKLAFYEILENRVENGEDIVLTCSSNGIYAIVDNSVGNCSTLIDYNEHKKEITTIILPNRLFKYLESNYNIDKTI